MDVGRDAVPRRSGSTPTAWSTRPWPTSMPASGVSIPSKRYKVIATASKHLPVRLLQRFQSLGRR